MARQLKWKRVEKLLAQNGVEVLVAEEEPTRIQSIGARVITVTDPRLPGPLWILIRFAPGVVIPSSAWSFYDAALEAFIQSRL